ncbi:MAG: hypothetical protein KFF50_14450, partial [Desulfatitalea sp.]|nr:hypothetical protein [Desulfatitalea sp.]
APLKKETVGHKTETPAKILRSVLDSCSDCDTCRFLMDESCLLFPELYRLYDQEHEQGRPASEDELRRLAELCTLCGLCPCPDIRADVIRGKTERVKREGMPLRIRLLADVQHYLRLGGRMPAIANACMAFPPVAALAKKLGGIHPDRRLPTLPRENFFDWASTHGLHRMPDKARKVAYFAGCTAGYLFPEVARAAVAVLERNGIGVFVPPGQQCCGMPTLVEGDQPTTLARAGDNLAMLAAAVRDGCDPVCSCPTCGFLFKVLLTERAVYSEAYQRSVEAGEDEIKLPDRGAREAGYSYLKKSMYRALLRDDGYFSDLDPLARLALADRVSDMGAYLAEQHLQGRLDAGFGRIAARMVYFAPCHQREQDIGTPYETLLGLIPGLEIRRVGGALDCCGMGGSLGFKESFHATSTRMGLPLMNKIKAAAPEAVVTDCLSCRLQFQHALPYPVWHPLELLARAYAQAE